MRAVGGQPTAWRTVKEYDAESAQFWYGGRPSVGGFYHNYYVGANTWNTPVLASHIGNPRILYRMGSMPQLVTDRVLSWIGSPFDAALEGGKGLVYWVFYNGPDTSSTKFLSDPNAPPLTLKLVLGRTSAVAAKPGADRNAPYEALMVYQDYSATNQQPYVAGSDIGKICFLRSIDSGLTWSFPTCGIPGKLGVILKQVRTRRYGLTATYDPYSDAFLVGFIADSYMGTQSPVDSYPAIAVFSIPAIGSATPYKESILGGEALEAPGVSCNGAADGCRIVWGDAETGALTWYNAGVSPTTGDVTANAAYQQGYLEFDTPSIAFNPADDSFKLASTTMNDAIYSFTMSSSATEWTGTGDIWNNSASFISAGAVSIRDFVGVMRIYTWFPRFI